MEKDDIEEDDQDGESIESISIEMIATCRQCGFSASPEDFEACLSAFNDLRCPECGTTDVECE